MPDTPKKITNTPESADSTPVVELSRISIAVEKHPAVKSRREKARILRPGLQLGLRLAFTLLAICYFVFNTRAPLLVSRPMAIGCGIVFIICFILFHFWSKKRDFVIDGVPPALFLDIVASNIAWLCDPWEPAPMLLLIAIMAIGIGAHYGFKSFRSLFISIAIIMPVVYVLRVLMIGFHPVALLFIALSVFLLAYTYMLIQHINALQTQAEKKTAALLYTNERLKQTGIALQNSEARYRNMFEHSGTATVLIEDNMVISMVNSKFEQLTKHSRNELCHKMKLTDFIYKEDLKRIKRFHTRRRSMGGTAPTEYECQLIDKMQNIKHVIIKFSIAPWHERIIATLVDITSRKQAKAALQKYNIRLQEVARKLKESELRYRSLFENTGTATIVVEKNMRIAMANSKFCEMTGFTKAEIGSKKRFTEFIERKNLYRIRRYHARRKLKGLPPPNEYECLIVDKARKTKHVVMKVFTPPGQESSIISFFDITSRKKAEAALQEAHEKLQELAVLDELTQIANRRRFDEALIREWNRLKREGLPISLIMCDVDCFKLYNDTYGHQAGDACLRSIADTIKGNIKRSVDIVARYGGEEFVVIMPNTYAEGAMKVAESIRIAVEQLKIPHDSSVISPFITLSLGVSSMIPTRACPPDRLVKDADNALYEAKRKGRNRTVMGKGKDASVPRSREDNVIKIN